MSTIKHWGALGVALAASVAWVGVAGAQDTPPQGDEDEIERAVGERPAPMRREGQRPSISRAGQLNEEMEDFDGRPLPTVAYRGAEALGMDPEFVYGCREGLKKLYLRQYPATIQHFAEIQVQYPGTAVAPMGELLVWQARMFENYDFRFDAEYQAASTRSKQELEQALRTPGNEAWEYFLLAGTVGIEAIHIVRQGSYLPALNKALDAMRALENTRQAAPEFVDLTLGDGMYNYWRTVVTMHSRVLPDFEDKRAEGIAQMEQVEGAGIFLAEASTLSLAFVWIEEGDKRKALSSALRNHRRYPDSIINNQVLGNVYLYQRRYDRAMEVYDQILRVDPTNRRVRYYRGLARLRSGDTAKARAEFTSYLAYDHLLDYQAAAAHYRMGQTYYKMNEYAQAEEEFRRAVKVNGHEAAKRRLTEMKRDRRAGTISY